MKDDALTKITNLLDLIWPLDPMWSRYPHYKCYEKYAIILFFFQAQFPGKLHGDFFLTRYDLRDILEVRSFSDGVHQTQPNTMAHNQGCRPGMTWKLTTQPKTKNHLLLPLAPLPPKKEALCLQLCSSLSNVPRRRNIDNIESQLDDLIS